MKLRHQLIQSIGKFGAISENQGKVCNTVLNYAVFKGYQMRTRVTRQAWEQLQKKATNTTVYCTFDYPMKYLLKKHRGTTIEWFAKVSLTVLKRIVTNI